MDKSEGVKDSKAVMDEFLDVFAKFNFLPKFEELTLLKYIFSES